MSSCCAAWVAFGVIVDDGGKPVSKTGCAVAIVVEVSDGPEVVLGVEVEANAGVKISIGGGDGIKECCNTGMQEEKIVARITIITVCNFIFPIFSDRKRPPNE